MTFWDGKSPSREIRLPENLQLYDGPEAKVWLKVFDNKIWINAYYKLDLTKSRNLRDTLILAESIFLKLASCGIPEIYCTADSQRAFNFNEYLGFKTTNMHYKNYEIMRREL